MVVVMPLSTRTRATVKLFSYSMRPAFGFIVRATLQSAPPLLDCEAGSGIIGEAGVGDVSGATVAGRPTGG